MEGIAPTTVPTIRMTTITMPDSNSTHHHEEDNHLLIFEGGKFSYVLIPPLPFEDPKLCFTDHGSGCEWDPRAEQCCLHEGGHVHAHVHNGEITEDVLLEQCMEEAGCALPMLWDLPGSCWKDFLEEKDHLHKAGCGHDQIAHGDHFDWVVPMNDGSFKLTHAYVNDDGVSQFVRHGRLVKVGESRGRLAKHPRQCFDLFEYEGPQLEGYKYRNSLMNMSTDLSSTLCTQPATSCPFMQNSSEVEKLLLQEDTTETLQVHVESKGGPQLELQKTTIDILGICCPAEVPLVKRILEPLPGVQKVLVNVAARTVTVRHDPALTSAAWLVKMLNDARLEASIHRQGEWKAAHKWPSPYTIACGIMVGLTFFQYMYSPLRWVGLAAVAVGIPPIILRGCVSLQRCILDINILMLIAVAGAIGLGDYLEAGSIVFLFTLADWLESRSSDKARLAISSVASLAPQNAFLADNGFKVPVAEVEVGTKLSVKAGDQVPIDGVVVCGKSVVDESSLTGESLPVEKVAGATVWAGTLNMTGYLCIETTALAEDSAVSRMVRLVEEAQTQRSHVEQLVEKFAKYYTPVVVIVAVAIATIPLCVHAHNVRHWLYVALVLLVVACPCALVISTPVTTTCAVARAARMGLIVKGGSSLEALGKLKVIAMDKTGTLTEGHFQVAEVRPLMNKNIDLPKLLYWISCIESKSSHPMASSFVAYAKLRGIEPSGEVEDFTILAGEGVSGVLDGHIIHIGNERLAKRLHWTEVIEAAEDSMLETWRSQGWSISWIGMDEKLEGLLCAGDHLRSEASEAVGDMRNLGLQIAMLTGDSLAAATAAQRELGEIEVHAQLLPQDKVEVLKQLRKIGLTGMVGDGINDAPALAAADVGIAMGVAGSAVAMETADIALMTNDLRQLAAAVKLGRKARRKIQQNIFLSLATKLLIIVLAGVGYASLWGAVLADVGTCLIVIFNSMLLLGREKEGELARHSHDHHIIDHKHCHDDDHINHTHHKHPHDDDDVRKASIKDCCCCCGGEGGTCSLLKLRLPDKFMSRCCKSRNGCCHDHSEHHVAKNFFVTSKAACCEFSGKRSTSNSRIRRRLGHKDTCEKDCQGIDCCNSTSAVIKPDGGLIGTAIRSGDTCLNETAGAGRVLHPDQILGLIPASKEDDKYQVDLCAAYCGSAETASSCTAADDLLCASYCSSSEPQLLCQDVSACAFYCQADNSLESQCCGKVNNNTSQ